MLESGLFFTLGFLCAALLALMVAPAIWRRAVVLTRQRIESSVPLTLNEIQADKDQLRAEFAMSTRRLEVSLEGLKEKAAEQLIEINRRRDEMLQLEETENKKTSRIADLEAQSAELRAEMKLREEKLHQATISLSSVQAQLEERALAYEELDGRYKAAVEDFDGQKIEMVARETRMDNMQGQARETKENLKSLASQKSALESELKSAKAAVKKEAKRVADREDKINRLQAQLADMEGRLERRDNDLAKLRGQSGENGSQLMNVQKELDKTQAEKVKLEAEVAEISLRMEALLKDASDDNIENAIATFESERKKMRDALSKAESERDALQVELSAAQLASGEDWEIERRENAIVRERINDLAAQVTAMTASIEGPDSPVNKALGADKKTTARSRSSKSKAESAAKGAESLADRIRALQAAVDRA